MTKIDLRGVEQLPDSVPVLDTEVSKNTPLFALRTRYTRAFQVDRDVMVPTIHGLQLARAGDYVQVDELNGLVHVSMPYIFESMFVECVLDYQRDSVSTSGAHLEGSTEEYGAFMQKVLFVTRQQHSNIASINVSTSDDGTIIANIIFNIA